MNCQYENNSDIYDQYLLGEISEEEIEKFEDHLFECKKCMYSVQLRKKIILAVKKREELKKSGLKIHKSKFNWARERRISKRMIRTFLGLSQVKKKREGNSFYDNSIIKYLLSIFRRNG